MLRALVLVILSTTGVWAQFGGFPKTPSIDTKKFDELLARIDTVGLRYDEGTAYVYQSAELLYQFVDKHHKLPSLSKTWTEVTKATNEAKTDSFKKLAREGLDNYLKEMQSRKLACDTIWTDNASVSALKKLLGPDELLSMGNAKATVDSAIAKDKELLETAKGLTSLVTTAITDLAGQIKKAPLAAVKLKSVLDKIQAGSKKLTEIIAKVPDQIEIGTDLVKKIAVLSAAR